MYNTSDSDKFHGHAHYSIKDIFSIFLLAGLIKFIVYLQVCHWLSKQVFYSTEIVFFVLIPRYGCFKHVCHIYIYVCVCVQSWKQCGLPVITTVSLWQVMDLGTWHTWCTNRALCVQVHQLPRRKCSDNHDDTWFSWLHIYIYIYIYMYILHLDTYMLEATIPKNLNKEYNFCTIKHLFWKSMTDL